MSRALKKVTFSVFGEAKKEKKKMLDLPQDYVFHALFGVCVCFSNI